MAVLEKQRHTYMNLYATKPAADDLRFVWVAELHSQERLCYQQRESKVMKLEESGKRERNSLADRAFRFLLRFFPSEFRGDYGREMETVFREQRRETEEGKVGLIPVVGRNDCGNFPDGSGRTH